MRYLLKASVIVGAIAFIAAAPSAVAQEVTITTNCSMVGHSAPEPLGDRDGHGYSVEEHICLDQSGPLVGDIYTGTVIWEWGKTNAVLVSGSGVVRKPGATAVVQPTEGNVELTMADGKVAGATRDLPKSRFLKPALVPSAGG